MKVQNNVRHSGNSLRNEGDHGVIPVLVVHEEIQHDSTLSDQGQASSLYTHTHRILHTNDDR